MILKNWPPQEDLFTNVKIELSKKWGADAPNYQELLNQAVENSSTTVFSKSHTLGLGGFAETQSDKIKTLGFDIELNSRVTVAPALRIAVSDSEKAFAQQHPAIFWTAKEASFKALRPFQQPSVVSKVELGSWQKSESQFESFIIVNCAEFKAPPLRGLVWIEQGYCFSIVLG